MKTEKRHFVFPLFSLLYGIKVLNIRLKPYFLSAIMMWFLCMLVTIVGPFAGQTNLMQIIKYLAFVVFFMVVSTYRFTEKDILFVAKGYVYISIVIALLIILSFLGGYQHIHEGEGGSVYYLGRYSIGITGLYKNPNYLASFICVAAFIVLYKMKKSTVSFKMKVLYLAVFTLFFVSCFLTGTRIALVVLFIIFIGVYCSSLRHFNLKELLLPTLLICVFLYLFGGKIGSVMDLYLGGRDMFGDEGREQAWPYALSLFYDNFLFGGGIDCWHHMTQGRDLMNNLHNVFLEFLLNQGVIGFVLLLYTVLYGYNKAKKRDRFILIGIFLVTAIPISFQNGVIAVNFWRFIIINRLALNYSIRSKNGIYALFKEKLELE